jgi:hypothetical protein
VKQLIQVGGTDSLELCIFFEAEVWVWVCAVSCSDDLAGVLGLDVLGLGRAFWGKNGFQVRRVLVMLV